MIIIFITTVRYTLVAICCIWLVFRVSDRRYFESPGRRQHIEQAATRTAIYLHGLQAIILHVYNVWIYKYAAVSKHTVRCAFVTDRGWSGGALVLGSLFRGCYSFVMIKLDGAVHSF